MGGMPLGTSWSLIGKTLSTYFFRLALSMNCICLINLIVDGKGTIGENGCEAYQCVRVPDPIACSELRLERVIVEE